MKGTQQEAAHVLRCNLYESLGSVRLAHSGREWAGGCLGLGAEQGHKEALGRYASYLDCGSGFGGVHTWHGVCAQSLQSYPTLCDPVDCSPPNSTVHGVLQARTLQWVAISFSSGSS